MCGLFGISALILVNPLTRNYLSRIYNQVTIQEIESVNKTTNKSIPKSLPPKSKNSCPPGFAYVGKDYCRLVKCDYSNQNEWRFGKPGGHDQLVAGKSNWECDIKGSWFDEKIGVLTMGDSVIPASHDSKCPDGEPAIGWNSTCEAPYLKRN